MPAALAALSPLALPLVWPPRPSTGNVPEVIHVDEVTCAASAAPGESHLWLRVIRVQRGD